MAPITLRRATADDASLVHAWRTEPSASSYQPTLPLSLDEVRAMLAERAATPIGPAAGKFQWLIEAECEPVGWVTLLITEENRPHGIGYVGYTIGKQFRGRGHASAGVAALLPIAFDRDGIAVERLDAIAAVENIASRRVLEKNGFRFEGVSRGLLIIAGERVDHAIYGLLRTDWEGS